MASPKIKICGITRLADARAALQLGVQALGFNFSPASPRWIDPAAAASLVTELAAPLGVLLVGVFVDTDREQIESTAATVGLNTIQLHGSESAELMRGWKPLSVIRAVRLGAPGWELLLAEAVQHADYVLLDSYVPTLPGGTGQTVANDLLLHPDVRGVLPKALLAGGLTPGNVAEKIQQLAPGWVDVASGVELSPGVKSIEEMQRFVDAVQIRG